MFKMRLDMVHTNCGRVATSGEEEEEKGMREWALIVLPNILFKNKQIWSRLSLHFWYLSIATIYNCRHSLFNKEQVSDQSLPIC